MTPVSPTEKRRSPRRQASSSTIPSEFTSKSNSIYTVERSIGRGGYVLSFTFKYLGIYIIFADMVSFMLAMIEI